MKRSVVQPSSKLTTTRPSVEHDRQAHQRQWKDGSDDANAHTRGIRPEVSAIGFGCMGLNFGRGAAMNRTDAVALVRGVADLGVTLFDTAEAYGPFTNEETVGEALQPIRDQAVIATKFGWRNGIPIDGFDSRPARIRQVAEESLKRLRTDHIDIFNQHRPDPDVPIEEVAGAVRDLVAHGKVKHFGLCEVGPDVIRRAHAVHPLSVVQGEYSLWWRAPEEEVFPVLDELGVGFVPFSPLGRGFLTGTMTQSTTFGRNDNRVNSPRLSAANRKANQPVVDAIDELAHRKGATPAQFALSWLLARKPWIVPIPGTTKLKRATENVGAAAVAFSSTELEEIDAVFAGIEVHGDHYAPDWAATLGGREGHIRPRSLRESQAISGFGRQSLVDPHGYGTDNRACRGARFPTPLPRRTGRSHR